MRLNFLSRQPEIILDSPYFEQRPSVFEDPDESKGHDFSQVETGKGATFSGFQNLASPSAAQSSSLETDKGDRSTSITSELAPSPSSGTSINFIICLWKLFLLRMVDVLVIECHNSIYTDFLE